MDLGLQLVALAELLDLLLFPLVLREQNELFRLRLKEE